MNLTERAAYIKGLTEGLELEADKKEVRVIKELLELAGELAAEVEDLRSDNAEMYAELEELQDEISFVGREVFGDIDEMYGDEMYEIVCPNCEETVRLDEEALISGDVVCPACGEKIEIEIDACDCGHHHD